MCWWLEVGGVVLYVNGYYAVVCAKRPDGCDSADLCGQWGFVSGVEYTCDNISSRRAACAPGFVLAVVLTASYSLSYGACTRLEELN